MKRNLTDKQKRANQQVEQDERDATIREGTRQAIIEKQLVIDAATKAEREAAVMPTREEAKVTFRERFMKFWTGEKL